MNETGRPARWWETGRLLGPAVWIGATLVGLAGGACTVAPRVVPSPHELGAGASAGTLRGYHHWWYRIAQIMEYELGFPRLDVELFLYPHQHALERALIDDGMPPDLARRAAGTLDAVGRVTKVMVNEASFRPLRWPQRLLVLSHELTHSAQYVLSGGRRGTSEQWLREGFAEWVAWHVAESLQMGSVGRHRHRAAARVLAARYTRSLPPLAELRSGHDLLAQLARHRQAPIYDQAFLAADLLITEHGAARVVEYFRFFAENDDAEANFTRAFSESYGAFVARFEEHLGTL
ncbi:MAG: hypothetical protein KA072_01635 [Thermoanaerobaculaceae bacterium]|nr:hypothetical protein [Thermoanaerobaculaceae bacterium]MDI9620649.1 hypothetical protein [Acidobacteriota bacterium]NLH10258.1 hypothetical protein [Holophagae bacterium]